MKIKQLSVFLENKEGRLLAALKELAENGLNIRALSLADTTDFGVLRLIISDPEKARAVLAASGVVTGVTDVLAVMMEDKPGGMLDALGVLTNAGINVEYMYACVGQTSGRALMVMQVDRLDAAEEVVSKAGLGNVNLSDIYG